MSVEVKSLHAALLRIVHAAAVVCLEVSDQFFVLLPGLSHLLRQHVQLGVSCRQLVLQRSIFGGQEIAVFLQRSKCERKLHEHIGEAANLGMKVLTEVVDHRLAVRHKALNAQLQFLVFVHSYCCCWWWC